MSGKSGKHRPGYYRDYYRSNRERERARIKAWRDANIEHCREVEAAWRKAHPEAVKSKQRKYRHKPESRAKDAKRHREDRKANPKRAKDRDKLFRLRKKARMAADPELYAHFRALKNAAKRRYDAKMFEMPERYARDRRHKRMSYARRMIAPGGHTVRCRAVESPTGASNGVRWTCGRRGLSKISRRRNVTTRCGWRSRGRNGVTANS